MSRLPLRVALVLRAAPRDAGALALWCAAVAATAALVAGGPAAITGILDAGARDAVRSAGAAASIALRVPVAAPTGDGGDSLSIDEVREFAGRLPSELPGPLRAAAMRPTWDVLTAEARLTRPGDDDGSPEISARLIARDGVSGATVVDGRAPRSRGSGPIEAALSVSTARALDVAVGETVQLRDPVGDRPVPVRISGLVEPTGGGRTDPALAGVWAGSVTRSRSGEPVTGVRLLTDATGGRRALAEGEGGLADGRVRIRLDPEHVTADGLERILEDLPRISTGPSAAALPTAPAVESGFADAVAGFRSAAAATGAQCALFLAASTTLAALLGLAASSALTARRRPRIALVRSRGAGLAGIAVRAAAEAVVPAVLGAVAGTAIARLATPRPDPAAALGIAAIATVVLAAAAAAAALGARPRRSDVDRERGIAAARTARRLRSSLAAIGVAAAIGVLILLRVRGLVPAPGAALDPLLLAAPIAVAASVAIGAAALRRPLASLAAAVLRRGRGVHSLLAAEAGGARRSPLALMSGVLAVSLAVLGSSILLTVDDGITGASWERVGAGARIDGPLPADRIAAIRAQPGVTASAVATDAGADAGRSGRTVSATVLAVDRDFAAVRAADPALASGDAALLRRLARQAAGDRVPVAASPELAGSLRGGGATITWRGRELPVRLIGITHAGPSGYRDGPFVLADAAAVRAAAGTATPVDTVLVDAPDPSAALRRAGVDRAHDVTAITRQGWMEAARTAPLAAGLRAVLVGTAVAGGLLAVGTLLVGTAARAPARRREAALARTLGVGRGVAATVALADAGPALAGSLVAGAAAGWLGVAVLGPALDLRSATGGLGDPLREFDPGGLAVVVAIAIVAAAGIALVETAASRGASLSGILREGGA